VTNVLQTDPSACLTFRTHDQRNPAHLRVQLETLGLKSFATGTVFQSKFIASMD